MVLIRFGHDWDPTCMQMDETLFSLAEKVKNFCVIYLVDISEVPDFNKVCRFWSYFYLFMLIRNKKVIRIKGIFYLLQYI